MKIALISDIHGNLEALTAVLIAAEQASADVIYCLGDVVGYGTDPSACLKLIDKTCRVKLIGNHEYTALGRCSTEKYTELARISSDWTRNILTDEDLEMIRQFDLDYSSDNTRFVHASPYEPEKWKYILKPDQAKKAFDCFDEAMCFVGHTHLPMIFTEVPNDNPKKKIGHDFEPHEESRYIVNVGSVGQPRDNDPRASFVIYDNVEQEVQFCRAEYDITTTQTKISQTELPSLLAERLAIGR